MKKGIIFVAAVSAMLVSCFKGIDIGNITQELTNTNYIDVPGLPGGVDTIAPEGITVYAPTKTVETNASTYMKEYNTSTEKVISVKLSKMSISVSQPTGEKFDFMDTINIYMSAPGQPEVLIAHRYGLPADPSTVEFDCDNSIEMKEYFLQDSMFVRFGGHFIKVPKANTQLEMKSTYLMTANPLK